MESAKETLSELGSLVFNIVAAINSERYQSDNLSALILSISPYETGTGDTYRQNCKFLPKSRMLDFK